MILAASATYQTLDSRQGKCAQARRSLGGSPGGEVFVDHLLLVDQVGGLHHQVHQLVGVAAPGVQGLQGILKIEINSEK